MADQDRRPGRAVGEEQVLGREGVVVVRDEVDLPGDQVVGVAQEGGPAAVGALRAGKAGPLRSQGGGLGRVAGDQAAAPRGAVPEEGVEVAHGVRDAAG